jgi:diguanylate cyclase (GGDEF)-like protein/PAS domain S-box-containing protein
VDVEPKSLFELVPDAILVVDAGGDISTVNSQAEQLFGYASQELIGQPVEILLPEQLRDLHQFHRSSFSIAPSRRTMGRSASRYTALRKDGSEFLVDISLSPLEQQPGSVIAAVRDVTERKRLETKMMVFGSALESMSSGTLITDPNQPDNPIIYANPAFEHITGYKQDEIIGRNCRFLQGDDTKQVALDEVRAAIKEERGCRVVLRNYRKDGSMFCNELILSPVHDAEGKLTHYIGIQNDVTKQEEAEAELQLAASVFDNAAEGIIISDTKHRIIRVNRAFTDITGYSAKEITGKTPRVLRSHLHDAPFYEQMASTLKYEGQWGGEIWNRRKNGEVFPIWQNISPIKNDKGEITQYISIFSDISEQKISEKRIQYLHHYDVLTSLPNRALFKERCGNAINRARSENRKVALLVLDLDQFKHINDSFGHPAGDRLLQLVATRLEKLVREGDTLARLGGDEFAILAESIRHSQDAFNISHKLLDSFVEPVRISDREYRLTASVGVSLFPDDGEDVTVLIRNADTAMGKAKEQGRNNVQFYTQELTESALQRVTLGNELQRALEQDELALFYQPQYSLKTGKMVGAEALIRWQHPKQGMIPPDQFIPLAEDNGLIIPMGEWVLRKACQQMRAWLDMGRSMERISVNVSGQQVQRGELVSCVERVLRETGLEPSHLELELTESFIMQQTDKVIDTLNGLNQLGVIMSIDDFGTGYSSLSYLKQLPVHKLKIDRSFVRDIPGNANDEVITRSVLALGQSLQLKVIAEGVETKEQQAFLRELNCDEVQGYLYSRPVPSEEFVNLEPTHTLLQ